MFYAYSSGVFVLWVYHKKKPRMVSAGLSVKGKGVRVT